MNGARSLQMDTKSSTSCQNDRAHIVVNSTFCKSKPFTTAPSVMNRLPLELAVMVMENLVDYDVASSKYSKYAANFTNNSVDVGKESQADWVKFATRSRDSILNARLSCWKLYNASSASFAALLGDRKFRFTKVGLDDLTAIAQMPDLASRITTLTIAGGGFRRVHDMEMLHKALPGVPAAVLEHLYQSYRECSRWQREHLPDFENTLAAHLRAFSMLKEIRIDAIDEPKHLGGWFQDRGYLPDYDDHIYTSLTSDTKETPLYGEKTFGFQRIMTALVNSEASIQDLRILGLHWNHWLDLVIPHFNLQTLRMTVTPKSHGTYGGNQQFNAKLVSWFQKSPVLTNISITIPTPDPMPRMSAIRKGLMTQTNLRRLCLSGHWILKESELVLLLKDHDQSLECLVLDKTILAGSWRAVLEAASRMAGGRMAFLRAYDVLELDPFRGPGDVQRYNFAALGADLAEPKDAAEWQVWLNENKIK